MKTLSMINELTHWGKAIKRSQSDDNRKEDDIKITIRDILEQMRIPENKYVINPDNSVDVDDDVVVSPEYIVNGKLPFKFGKVNGFFEADDCLLTSLENFPDYIKGDCNVSYNQLESLNGCPKEIGGSFNCNRNLLKSLIGGPEKVGGAFKCSGNADLESLEGCPKEVGFSFIAMGCNLKSLKGCPKYVSGRFSISKNPNLESLEGCPEHVGKNFVCKGNKDIFTEDYIRSLCQVDGDIFLFDTI